MQEWLGRTATDLGRAIDAGDIDPVNLLEVYLDAIDAHPMTPRIYARTTPARAMQEAQAARLRSKSGTRLSLLDGVPISWKDLFDTADVVTEAGSNLLKDRKPNRDAAVLQNATAAGLVCLGKTHMSELAFSGLGLNPMTATSPCVNDHAAVSGGSSSGAAASVAFGLAACGIGTDTGGSVRIPAAWNDLVGLKTTVGRVSSEGVVPLCEKFDTVGPLCRSVEDAAVMLAILEGGRAVDLRGASLAGRRLAVLKTVVMDDIRDAPAAAFAASVQRLEAAGAQISEVDAPELTTAMALSSILFTAEAYGIWRDQIEAAPHLMFAQILERFRSGADVKAADYVAAWRTLEQCRKAWQARMAGYDAVICPTAPNLPPQLDLLMSDHDYYVTENLLTLRNTRVGNMMGLSAVTLPTGTPSCGLMLLGAPMGEERLLRLAAAAEIALR